MVKKRSKTELLEDAVGTMPYHNIKKAWREKMRWSYMPVKRMAFFGILGVFLLGYGVADLSGPLVTVQQACAVAGALLILLVAHVGRKHVMESVRAALFDSLKEQRSKVCWSTYDIEMFPRDLIRKENWVEDNGKQLDEFCKAFTKRLWGNLLFFVPSRVDRYLLEVMASEDMSAHQQRAENHVQYVKELVQMIETARVNSNVVAMRRGGGIETVF